MVPFIRSTWPFVQGWFGESVFDATSAAHSVEKMSSEACDKALTVLRQVCELDAVVGEHAVNAKERLVEALLRRKMRPGCRLVRGVQRRRTWRCGRWRRRDRVCLRPYAPRPGRYGKANRIAVELLPLRFPPSTSGGRLIPWTRDNGAASSGSTTGL
jgi:hypothetical protein